MEEFWNLFFPPFPPPPVLGKLSHQTRWHVNNVLQNVMLFDQNDVVIGLNISLSRKDEISDRSISLSVIKESAFAFPTVTANGGYTDYKAKGGYTDYRLSRPCQLYHWIITNHSTQPQHKYQRYVVGAIAVHQ